MVLLAALSEFDEYVSYCLWYACIRYERKNGWFWFFMYALMKPVSLTVAIIDIVRLRPAFGWKALLLCKRL